MKKALGWAALGCALGIADSKALKWGDNGPRWIPPQETLAYMPSLGMGGFSPTTTPAPYLGPREAVDALGLHARDTKGNTCAYVGGTASELDACGDTATAWLTCAV